MAALDREGGWLESAALHFPNAEFLGRSHGGCLSIVAPAAVGKTVSTNSQHHEVGRLLFLVHLQFFSVSR